MQMTPPVENYRLHKKKASLTKVESGIHEVAFWFMLRSYETEMFELRYSFKLRNVGSETRNLKLLKTGKIRI